MKQWTILEILKWTTDFFLQNHIPSPRVDAEILIAFTLNIPRLQLYLQFDRPLTPEERQLIRQRVVRRARREPLQYITGTVEFHDTILKVDPRVLIPRPETEQMVDAIIHQTPAPSRILDIGTGSGAIAITLARTFPEAEVHAVDISSEALELASENARANDASRIRFYRSDIFSKVDADFDLIVSNPPYIDSADWGALEPEITGYEPSQALLAKQNGLACLVKILGNAKKYLRTGGVLYLEFGRGQRAQLQSAVRDAGFSGAEFHRDWNGFDRWMRAGTDTIESQQ